MGEEAVAEIEAEQSLLANSIEEARRLSARSDTLMDAARGKFGQSEGEIGEA
jgi:hypothetical protein